MKNTLRSLNRFLTLGACLCILFDMRASGQSVLARFEMSALTQEQLERELRRTDQPSARSEMSVSPRSAPAAIALVVLEGEGVTANASRPVTHNLAVRVEDDDHRPVAGASVTFVLPATGASGEFTNGTRSRALLTDNQGVAAARGFKTNQIPGKLQIYVVASYRGLRANTLITQVIEGVSANTKAPERQAHKSGGKWKWVALGIAAAGGAGAGIYLGTQAHSSSSSSSSSISITAGQVVFGSPR